MKTLPESEAVRNNPASLSASEVTQVKSAVATARAAMKCWWLKTLLPDVSVKAAAWERLSREYCCPSLALLTRACSPHTDC